MLKRRPLDGKFPGRGCAQKSAPVKGLADAALHRALLMMRGMCEGTEPMGKQPSSASAPGLWGPSGSPPFPSTMSLQGPTGSEQNSCGKENFDTVVESDETSPEISPVSPSDRIPLRVGKRKGSPDSPWDLEKLAPQGLLELSGGLSRGNDSASAQVTHTSAGTPSAQGCSSICLSCAQGQLHMRTMMIVIILSNLFSKTADILRVGLVCTFVTHWQDRQGQAGDSNQIQSWKTWEAESMSLPRPGRKSRRCPLDLKHQTGTVWIRAGCFLRHKKLNQNKAPSDTFTKLTTIKKKKRQCARQHVWWVRAEVGHPCTNPHAHTPSLTQAPRRPDPCALKLGERATSASKCRSSWIWSPLCKTENSLQTKISRTYVYCGDQPCQIHLKGKC